jgi:hypothetical protein
MEPDNIKTDTQYTITNKEGTITGNFALICTKCFMPTCTCNSDRYRGMLCREETDQNGNKKCCQAYIASPYINPLIDANQGISPFEHIFRSAITAAIPDMHVPVTRAFYNCQNGSSYDVVKYCNTSKLYLSEQDDLCILDEIPDIQFKHTIDMYPTVLLDSVNECMISSNGTCTRRKAYFEFSNKEYPFGILSMFPSLYKHCLHSIQTQQCNVKRNTEKTIFYNIDFFQSLPIQPGTQEALEHCFTFFNTYGNFIKDYPGFVYHWHSIRTENIIERYLKIFQDKKRILQNTSDLVKFALCAKLTGNNPLAISFLYIYDDLEEKVIREPMSYYLSFRKIYIKPFGGIRGFSTTFNDLRFGQADSKYNNVLNDLTAFSTIEHEIEVIKQHNRVVVINPATFIQICKQDTRYILYPWKFKPVSYGCHPCEDWIRGKKCTLIHCYGNIIGGSVDDDLKKFSITEERSMPNGTKRIIEHMLKAGELISAQASINKIHTENPLITKKSTKYGSILHSMGFMKYIVHRYIVANAKSSAYNIYNYARNAMFHICKIFFA